MEYYRITQKDNIRNTIMPEKVSASEIWEKDSPFFLPGIADRPEEDLVFLPFYESSAFLISGPVKTIWESYQRGGRYRPCAFGSVEQRKIVPYCFMAPRMIDCIHPDTEYYKNGDVRTLCLDGHSIGANRIFGVRTLRRIRLIIAEDVLEEMIREKIIGYNWEQILIH